MIHTGATTIPKVDCGLMKIYKRTVYWVDTKTACGALAIDQDGYLYELDTCPYFKKAFKGKRFSEIMMHLKSRKNLLNCKELRTEIDPF